MAIVTIDGQRIEAAPGQRIIEVADRNGIEIPRFCYHPDLPVAGNCRMCLVEIEKMSKLMIACNTEIADGMIIHTGRTSKVIRETVQEMLEFTLINHPIDCPVCDQAGECSLQDFYMEYGLYNSKVNLSDKVKKEKAKPISPLVVLDQERCVLCSRCVRFTDHISQSHGLQFFERGTEMVIDTVNDNLVNDPYSGNVVDLCPVGALTNRDFRFKCRVWFLSYTDSVCAGCSTGCNLRIDHNQGRIYRLVPRRNVDVNHSWLCDEGRMSFKSLEHGQRLTAPNARINGGIDAINQAARVDIDWPDALDVLHNNLVKFSQSSTALAGIASASATNETLYLFQRYFAEILHSDNLDFRLNGEDEKVTLKQDEILRHVDKHPNTMGAMLLGLRRPDWPGLTGLLEQAQSGALQALLLLYYPPLVGDEDARVIAQLAEIIQQVKFSAVLTTQAQEWMKAAQLLLPLAAWSEEAGTYTNFNNQVQKVEIAVSPKYHSRPAWQVFYDLCRQGGISDLAAEPAAIFNRLVANVPQYQGLDYDHLISDGSRVYPPEGRHAYAQKA